MRDNDFSLFNLDFMKEVNTPSMEATIGTDEHDNPIYEDKELTLDPEKELTEVTVRLQEASEDPNPYLKTEDLAKLVSISIPKSSGPDTGKYIKTEDLAREVEIPVPGGDKESPSTPKYSDGYTNIPVPSSAVITVDEYNKALALLKKSYKEGFDTIAALEKCQIVNKTMEEYQDEFTEAVLDEALLESFEDGPYFEAVDRKDKGNVKTIVRNLRSKIVSSVKDEGYKIYKPAVVIRLLCGLIPVAGTKTAASGVHQVWTKRLWQVLGIVNIETANVKELCDKLTDEFKDDLGEYKVLYAKALSSLHDTFVNRFGWKNSRSSYFLLIDKKLPSEIKTFQDEVDTGIKADSKNESVEEFEESSYWESNEEYNESTEFQDEGVVEVRNESTGDTGLDVMVEFIEAVESQFNEGVLDGAAKMAKNAKNRLAVLAQKGQYTLSLGRLGSAAIKMDEKALKRKLTPEEKAKVKESLNNGLKEIFTSLEDAYKSGESVPFKAGKMGDHVKDEPRSRRAAAMNRSDESTLWDLDVDRFLEYLESTGHFDEGVLNKIASAAGSAARAAGKAGTAAKDAAGAAGAAAKGAAGKVSSAAGDAASKASAAAKSAVGKAKDAAGAAKDAVGKAGSAAWSTAKGAGSAASGAAASAKKQTVGNLKDAVDAFKRAKRGASSNPESSSGTLVLSRAEKDALEALRDAKDTSKGFKINSMIQDILDELLSRSKKAAATPAEIDRTIEKLEDMIAKSTGGSMD